jgi:hypothetical protein
MVRVAAFDGVGLVAVDGGAGGRIVAEATCTPLPDGDGELALTVAPDWRGWLGPFLLDALARAAEARGIPNFEADVLATNRRMLALARARGYVAMDHVDWSVLRILLGTRPGMPTWPPGTASPRVLVEASGGRWSAEADATAAGLHVLTCAGPEAVGRRCPLSSGRPCPLAAGADAVVVAAPKGDAPSWRALCEAHARVHPGTPVVVDSGGRPAEETLAAVRAAVSPPA